MDPLVDAEDDRVFDALRLPGTKRGDDGSRSSRVEVLTLQVGFSATGREWATVSMEGLHVYSLDEDMIFDPISLTEAVTPAAVTSRLSSGDFAMALTMAFHLNEFSLVKDVLGNTPYDSIPHVVRMVGTEHLERLMQFLSKIMTDSPHVEFYLQWALQVLQIHGAYLETHRGVLMRSFRALYKAIETRNGDFKSLCDKNRYNLEFVINQAGLKQESLASSSK